MSAIVEIYSQTDNDIKKFVNHFFGKDVKIENNSSWQIVYDNPLQAIDIISCYIDNNDKFSINMWVSFDKDFFINVTSNNVNNIIKYLFERYPY